MTIHIIRHLRVRKPLMIGLVVAYCLFALTPFLFLHAHSDNSVSMKAGVVHAHVPVSTDAEHSHDHTHDHAHGNELSHLVEHAETHAQESSGNHFGMDVPPPVLTSPNASYVAIPFLGVPQHAFLLIAASPPDLERLPAETGSFTPCHFADGFPPFLTSALPPPSLA